MVSRTPRTPAPAVASPSSRIPGQDPARTRVINFSATHVADLVPVTGTTQPNAVIPDPCAGGSGPLRIVGPTPHALPETIAKVGQLPPRPTASVACADDTRCICSLSGHITDPERTVMDDVCGQAARLATVLRWVLALAALAVLIVLMR